MKKVYKLAKRNVLKKCFVEKSAMVKIIGIVKKNLLLLSLLGIGVLILTWLVPSVSASSINSNTALSIGTQLNTSTSLGSIGVVAGSIYNISITSNTISGKYAGIVGNLSGKVLLGNTSSLGNIVEFKNWSLSNITGYVLASTNSSVTWASLTNQTGAGDIDTVFGFGTSDSDNSTATWSASTYINLGGGDRTVRKATTNSNNSGYVWNTYQLNLNASALANGNDEYLVFAGQINDNAVAWDGTNKDYQILVPQDNQNGAGTATTYYLYIELR